MKRDKAVRIGGASAFIFDTSVSVPQLVRGGGIDYLVFDYLAEVTMSILTHAKTRNPALGYARKFVETDMRGHLKEIAAKGIKVVANAGGATAGHAGRPSSGWPGSRVWTSGSPSWRETT